jgi:quercetin dioxygenase-like cupin family protein
VVYRQPVVIAHPENALENRVTGERLVFRRTGKETGGETLEYELVFKPQGFVVREHLHPGQSERHEVVSGQLGLRLPDGEHVLRAGDVVDVPAGTPHRLSALDDQPVQAVFELRPALRSEELLRAFFRLAKEGKVDAKGNPGLLQLALIAREFEAEGYATKPPLPVQKALLGPLAALARRRGYGLG